MSSVAKASRDSIIRAWKAWVVAGRARSQGSGGGAASSAQRLQRKLKFTSLGSLAVEKHPELLPQARGQLWWQDVSPAQRKRPRVAEQSRSSGSLAAPAASAHTPESPLKKYINEHRVELMAELELRRSQATQAEASGNSTFEIGWLAGKKGWLDWRENNDAKFRGVLRSMRGGKRKVVNRRLTPIDDLQSAVPPPRLQPQRQEQRLAWATLVSNGWFLLTGQRCVGA